MLGDISFSPSLIIKQSKDGPRKQPGKKLTSTSLLFFIGGDFEEFNVSMSFL